MNEFSQLLTTITFKSVDNSSNLITYGFFFRHFFSFDAHYFDQRICSVVFNLQLHLLNGQFCLEIVNLKGTESIIKTTVKLINWYIRSYYSFRNSHRLAVFPSYIRSFISSVSWIANLVLGSSIWRAWRTSYGLQFGLNTTQSVNQQ